MEEWFKKCDKNKDGKIDIGEVKPYIKSWTGGEFAIEATEIFNKLDKNGDLHIDKQELFTHIKKALEMREGVTY